MFIGCKNRGVSCESEVEVRNGWCCWKSTSRYIIDGASSSFSCLILSFFGSSVSGGVGISFSACVGFEFLRLGSGFFPSLDLFNDDSVDNLEDDEDADDGVDGGFDED